MIDEESKKLKILLDFFKIKLYIYVCILDVLLQDSKACMSLVNSVRFLKNWKKSYNEEFDPGSGRTLAACLTHASQGERETSESLVNWRTGE